MKSAKLAFLAPCGLLLPLCCCKDVLPCPWRFCYFLCQFFSLQYAVKFKDYQGFIYALSICYILSKIVFCSWWFYYKSNLLNYLNFSFLLRHKWSCPNAMGRGTKNEDFGDFQPFWWQGEGGGSLKKNLTDAIYGWPLSSRSSKTIICSSRRGQIGNSSFSMYLEHR